MTGLEIRTMSRSELDFAIALAAREGWNPGLHDADAFFAADPQGFLVGLLNGQPVGCISAVSYGGKFGFLGLYIVLPEHRGKGIGIRLWQAAMQKLAGHNVGLDGVVAQQDNYRKSGFRLAYRNIRFEGRGTGSNPREHAALQPLHVQDIAQVEAYDRAFFPAPRPSFLRAWIGMPDAGGLAWMEHGKMKGMGMIRQCRSGYKIGPLNADSPAIADALYQALCRMAPQNEPVYLDVPEVNAEALCLANRYKLQKVFETARMYSGQFPQLQLEKLYGVTSFELG